MKFINLIVLFIMSMTLMNYAVVPNRYSVELQVCVVSCDIYHGFMANEQASYESRLQVNVYLAVSKNPLILVSGNVPTTGFTNGLALNAMDTNITGKTVGNYHV